GDKDVIAATDGNGLWLFKFNGSGFDPGIEFESGVFHTTSLAVGDVDHAPNGLPDLVVGNDNQPNRLYLNTGGAFAAGTNITADPTTPCAVAGGDDRGEGGFDPAGENKGNGQINRLYLNNGAGGFAAGTNIDITAHETVGIALADVDNDGHADLVVANHQEPS